jgi:hypothetical protein
MNQNINTKRQDALRDERRMVLKQENVAKYRDTMNTAIEELRNCLPEINTLPHCEALSLRLKDLSQLEVIQLAIEVIKSQNEKELQQAKQKTMHHVK